MSVLLVVLQKLLMTWLNLRGWCESCLPCTTSPAEVVAAVLSYLSSRHVVQQQADRAVIKQRCFAVVGALLLQHLFAQMAIGRGMYVLPRSFWHAFKDYDGTPIDVKEHQDAYEFFTRLQVNLWTLSPADGWCLVAAAIYSGCVASSAMGH
jgi:hypothetical protein